MVSAGTFSKVVSFRSTFRLLFAVHRQQSKRTSAPSLEANTPLRVLRWPRDAPGGAFLWPASFPLARTGRPLMSDGRSIEFAFGIPAAEADSDCYGRRWRVRSRGHVNDHFLAKHGGLGMW